MEITLQKRCRVPPLYHLLLKEKKGLFLKLRTLPRQTKAEIVERNSHVFFFQSHGFGEGTLSTGIPLSDKIFCKCQARA